MKQSPARPYAPSVSPSITSSGGRRGGTARFSSPLSVDDFVKKSQLTYYTGEALARVGADVAYFAEKEGLTAHARSVTIRLEDAER